MNEAQFSIFESQIKTICFGTLFTLVFGSCWVSLYLHRSFICMCVRVVCVFSVTCFVILHRSFCWCGVWVCVCVCKAHWHAHLKQSAWFLCRQTVLSVSCTVFCVTAGRQQGSHRGAVNKNSHISFAPGSGSESSCWNVVSKCGDVLFYSQWSMIHITVFA